MRKFLIIWFFTILYFSSSKVVFADTDTPPGVIPTAAGTNAPLTFSASSSATPTPRPTVTPPPTATPSITGQCLSLKIVEGNNAKAPALVKFEANASDSFGSVSTYHFYFGDGEKAEVMSKTASHTYDVSGNYTARVYIRDSRGNLLTSNACEVPVIVQSNSVESHRSGCSNLFFESGNNQKAPTTLKVRLEGFDNKGNIQKYRVDFGNGVIKEQDQKVFEQTFDVPGTYPIKGYVRDSHGNWKGGDGSCRQNAAVLTENLKEQPKTGVPILLAFGMAGMGGVGAIMQKFGKKTSVTSK